MRLRQIAFIAQRARLRSPSSSSTVFGLKVGFRDPGVEFFGLKNVVMPVGGEFLEVVAPFRDDASRRPLPRPARRRRRLHGDPAGRGRLAHRARLEAAACASSPAAATGRYQYTHFHPGDCAGVLMSFDSVDGRRRLARAQERLAAGRPGVARAPERRRPRHRRGDNPGARPAGGVRALVRAARPAGHAPAATRCEIALDRGVIRFVAPVDDDGTGVVGLDIEVRDGRRGAGPRPRGRPAGGGRRRGDLRRRRPPGLGLRRNGGGTSTASALSSSAAPQASACGRAGRDRRGRRGGGRLQPGRQRRGRSRARSATGPPVIAVDVRTRPRSPASSNGSARSTTWCSPPATGAQLVRSARPMTEPDRRRPRRSTRSATGARWRRSSTARRGCARAARSR